MVNEELHELLEGFVSESLDSLDDNEVRIARLDEDDPSEDLKAIFRVFHTLKGLSGFFELNIINKVTHEAETLLDIFRENPVPLSQDNIDLLYVVFDFLQASITYVSENLTDEPLEDKAQIIIEQLNIKIKEFGSKKTVEKSESTTEKQDNSTSEDDDYDIDVEYITMVTKLIENINEFKENIEEFDYIKESIDLIHKLKETDTIKEKKNYKDILESMLLILDALNEGAIPPDFDTFSIIDSDLQVLEDITNIDESAEISVEAEVTEFETDIQQQDEIVTEDPIAVEPEEPIENKEPDSDATVMKEDDIPKKPIDIKSSTEIKNDASSSDTSKKTTTVRKEVRVSTEKLNKLFDLVGEIITIESMVINNKDLEGLDLPNFSIASNMLNKLTRELQSVTTSIRMIPLSGAFNKMNRLVRDISRKFDKKIELEIFGEETEMDKNLIEEISDPLVHMIRNAIDHGVEKPEDRIAKGKPEEGKVVLGAAYQGNEIHIIIEDDGAGLNREKILKKAVERGLVTGDPNELTDSQVWQLIFEPGLSTAEKVTDVSGRGVGMDVVKKNIEKLRGSIDVSSKLNEGTRLTFRIPLTLAIMDALLIRVGNARYALPILSVRESFKPDKKEVTRTMDGIEMAKVRNDLYPIIKLYELMNIKTDIKDLEDGILMVLHSTGKTVCLFVDEIIGQTQAVLKPLSEYIGEVKGVTGCMVMSDGKIGLILDVDSLIKKAEDQEMINEVL